LQRGKWGKGRLRSKGWGKRKGLGKRKGCGKGKKWAEDSEPCGIA